VYSINPDGSGLKDILPVSAGYLPDDLIFDAKGGFYFTDFNGYSTNPKGAVFYVSPDFKKVTKVLPNLSIGNGICLAPGGKTLWVTELGASRLHRVNLADAVTIAPFGATISYRFTGSSGPDSMCVDIDGNMYVAMYPQGRILVFNKDGFPIGQILIPGREKGEQLYTTSMCFKPGTNDMVITTNDGEWTGKDGEDLGAWLYKCKGFAKELPLYSHQ
jgi:lactonase